MPDARPEAVAAGSGPDVVVRQPRLRRDQEPFIATDASPTTGPGDRAELAALTAWVSGAASGIGQAIAYRLAQAGADVVATDLRPPLETARMIGERPGSCLPLTADTSSATAVQAAFGQAVERYGHVDIVVPNAAIGDPASFLSISEAEWDRVLAVNLKGAVLMLQAALPAMIERAAGSIVTISSVAARAISIVNGAHYTCSKYAIIGLTRHLATELGGTGVRINCVCPGPTLTPRLLDRRSPQNRAAAAERTPLRRLADGADIAEVVLFVAGSRARHVHGAVLDVNGGLY